MKTVMIIFWILSGQPTMGEIHFNSFEMCQAAIPNVERAVRLVSDGEGRVSAACFGA